VRDVCVRYAALRAGWRPWFCMMRSMKRERTWCEEKKNQEKKNQEKKNQEKDKYNVVSLRSLSLGSKIRDVCVRYAALRAGWRPMLSFKSYISTPFMMSIWNSPFRAWFEEPVPN